MSSRAQNNAILKDQKFSDHLTNLKLAFFQLCVILRLKSSVEQVTDCKKIEKIVFLWKTFCGDC